MLIHDRFVFLHMPKTGGLFVRGVLERELSGLWSPPDVPRHLHHSRFAIPDWATDKPVLAFVRNPWDWYVSWYHFFAERAPRAAASLWTRESLTRWLFADRRSDSAATLSDFATTVQRACGNGGGRTLAEVARHHRLHDPPEGLDAPPEIVTPWLPTARVGERLVEGYDIYSAGFLSGLGGELESETLTIGRFESLIADLERFLAEAGVGLSADAQARIRSEGIVNASSRSDYRDYYDVELRDLVETSCGELIDRFGYRF